jgi:carbon monoxide dehydrogenase subunit G
MEMTGAYRIAAWAALNDPSVLRQCIPGCEKMEKLSDTAFQATIKARIGPVSASFEGAVTLEDLDPPNGYRLVGEGKGGVAGFAKGGATVKLEAQEGATVLSYGADARVGGKLAQIGSRLVAGAARKLIEEFFRKFAETVAPGAPAEKLTQPAEDPAQ